MLFGMLFLLFLMSPILLMLAYILFGCLFGFKRVFAFVNRGHCLVTVGVAVISFLLGMAFVIYPIVKVNSDKYGNDEKFGNILCYIDWYFEDDTVYAPGYSAENFNKIEIGMTPEQVLELVGEPLKKSEARWDYTALRKNDRRYSYWIREVYFDSDKKVSKIDTSYWWD